MTNPHEINPICKLHIRATQDRFPRCILFFRYYEQFWKATPTGFAIVDLDQIERLALSLANHGRTVAILNDLHKPPFDGLHFNAAENFGTIIQPE